MHLEKHSYQKKAQKRGARMKFFVFLIFIFIIGAIIFTIYPQKFGFTGMSIFPEKTNNNSFSLNTSISIPELTLKNSFPELRIILATDSSINIGGKTFSLKETERELILKNFDGTIMFDENKLYILKGKTSEIILSGIPITQEKNKINIDLNQQVEYKKIFLSEKINIKSLEYIAFGEIKVNEDILKLNSELISFNNFYGTLKSENQKLSLDGYIDSIEINGETRKIKIS